jgi:cytochrome c peroxidase
VAVGTWRTRTAPPPPQGPEPRFTPEQLAVFAPLPRAKDAPVPPEDTAAQVELGRMLFFEPRLSRAHDVSCNSCHGLTSYGVDNKPVSQGHRQQKGTRNSPTVFHAAGHIAQFWDGRAATLEEQAAGPLLNPVEMAMPDEARVVATLSSIPEYQQRFAAAFPGEETPVSLAHAARALAAFERTLVTRGRFDDFLAGRQDALTGEEKQGLSLFLTAGCSTCHNGPAVGGTSFQKLGLVEEVPGVKDEGRYEATKKEFDRRYFRVPTLRNVARTHPYLHDGSVGELDAMVRLMGRHQLGRTFSDAEVASLTAFLGSLTGELPQEAIRAPALPPSSPTTPKPDPT